MHHSYLECVLVYILTEGLNQYRRPLKWLLPRSRSQDTEPLEGARTETNLYIYIYIYLWEEQELHKALSRPCLGALLPETLPRIYIYGAPNERRNGQWRPKKPTPQRAGVPRITMVPGSCLCLSDRLVTMSKEKVDRLSFFNF